MSSITHSNLLKPGVSLGPYPQRNENQSNWLDTIGENLRTEINEYRTKQRLKLDWVINKVNASASNLPQWGSDDFSQQLLALKQSMQRDGLEDELIFEAFALIRECAEHTLGMRHHDVQIFGAWVMINGQMAEMGTGEGKSLTATLAAACAAMAKIPVHVITTNEYLAIRDAEEMAPLYNALGLSTGSVCEAMSTEERRDIYAQDIAYCTNKQVAFDYLRDRLVMGGDNSDKISQKFKSFDVTTGPTLRGLCYAIVDEADSVLIDEACTPLLLSREIEDPEQQATYSQALNIAQQLQSEQDYLLKPRERSIALTETGRVRVSTLTENLRGLWTGSRRSEMLVHQALCALYLFANNQHYLVRNDKVEIVDMHTGRSMPDRSWEQGLHQMIECKESCKLTGQRETLTRISYQRFFRRYLRLSGMSGTLAEVSTELKNVYRQRVVFIPPNIPPLAAGLDEQVFRRAEDKWRAVLDRIESIHANKQPILVGTSSVADSEMLSKRLKERNVGHNVLNAMQDKQEARVIAAAGRVGAVTIATNMAGRGTDIKLSEKARVLGGLHVLATERNESRRVDRQLFGRCGRQGDPGSYEVFVSLHDSLIANHYSHSLKRRLGHDYALKRLLNNPRLAQLLTIIPQRVMQKRYRDMRRSVLEQDQHVARLLSFTGTSE